MKLGALFRKKEGTPHKPIAQINLAQLNFKALPLLSAEELIMSLQAESVVRSIKRLVAVPETHWAAIYDPVLTRFIEAAQLAPASMAHHHSGPGGLVVHTLEVLEIALRLRKPLVLPKNADPDTSARQEHIWTYALFIAVLLHDLGKLMTTTRLWLDCNKYWSPYLNCAEFKGRTYQVKFLSAPYKLHQRIANSGLHLVPEVGVAWLAQFPEIMAQVNAYLYGDHFDAGIIGELAQKADGESVAKNLGGQQVNRVVFPGVPVVPLVDMLVTGLRQMLETNELKLNSHGADGWMDSEYVWLVCGTVAKKLIEYLRRVGLHQIPTDNNRIFDTLQEHGFVVQTENGKAIWHTRIIGPDNAYRFQLTMLKFEIGRLLPPSRRQEFAGQIEVVDPGQIETTDPMVEPESANESVEPAVVEPAPDTRSVDPVKVDSVPDWMMEEDGANESTEHAPGEKHQGESSTPEEPMEFSDIKPCDLDDDVGQYFLDWLSRMVRSEKLPVNRQDAAIHIVQEGALVVSPRTFKEFVKFYDLKKRRDGGELSCDDAAKHVQKKVEKLRKNIKTKKGMSIHSYTVAGPNKSSRVSGFLFDPLQLYGHVSVPKCNPLLKLPEAS